MSTPGAGTWAGMFESSLADRGYSMRSAVWDPLYGWEVLYVDAAGREREIHAGSSRSVLAQIERLPACKPTAGSS